MSTRIAALMEAIGYSQTQMANELCCDRTTISRLVNGRPEQGLQTRVLDQLAINYDLPHLTAVQFSPPGGSSLEPGLPAPVRASAADGGSSPSEGAGP